MKVYEKTKTRTWEVVIENKKYIVERFENLQTDFSIWEVFDHRERKVQNTELENEVIKVVKLKLDE
jgi:hypothetical protein